MACRDMRRGSNAAAEIIEQTRNKNVVVRKLDLASFDSVRKFAQEILDTEPKLHILVNNAGMLL